MIKEQIHGQADSSHHHESYKLCLIAWYGFIRFEKIKLHINTLHRRMVYKRQCSEILWLEKRKTLNVTDTFKEVALCKPQEHIQNVDI